MVPTSPRLCTRALPGLTIGPPAAMRANVVSVPRGDGFCDEPFTQRPSFSSAPNRSGGTMATRNSPTATLGRRRTSASIAAARLGSRINAGRLPSGSAQRR